jgi:hypothetical protein
MPWFLRSGVLWKVIEPGHLDGAVFSLSAPPMLCRALLERVNQE